MYVCDLFHNRRPVQKTADSCVDLGPDYKISYDLSYDYRKINLQ